MQCTTYNITEVIGNLILTYPDRFVINIYCKTKEVIDNLIKPMCNLSVHLPSVLFAISNINEDNAVIY